MYVIFTLWRTQASSYGYRYLIAPLAALPLLAGALRQADRSALARLRVPVLASAALALFVIWMLETKPELRLRCGLRRWTSEALIPQAFASVFKDPASLVRSAALSPAPYLAIQFVAFPGLARYQFENRETVAALVVALIAAVLLLVWALWRFARAPKGATLPLCNRAGP